MKGIREIIVLGFLMISATIMFVGSMIVVSLNYGDMPVLIVSITMISSLVTLIYCCIQVKKVFVIEDIKELNETKEKD